MGTTPLALAGMLRYVQSIEPALAATWRTQYRAGSKKSHDARPDQSLLMGVGVPASDDGAAAAEPDTTDGD
jgi:hypothetical protein